MKRSEQGKFCRQLAVASACALMVASPARAQNLAPTQAQIQAGPQEYDVAAGDLKTALGAFITQSGVQLLYKLDDVRGLTTKGLKGAWLPEAALSKLLEGTRLSVHLGRDGAMAIVAMPSGASLEPGSGSVQALDAVVITATRRRELAREVPLQVAVLQGEALERAGAKSLIDYLAGQPGIDMSTGNVVGQLSIRGVSIGPQSIASVGVYVDDVATGSSSAYAGGSAMPLDMGMLDLHHIEVLRGPQGTLYGAGAMSGLIKYVTHQPDTTEFSGRVGMDLSATQAGGINSSAHAVLNVPIKEDVSAVRVAAFRSRQSGYIRAVGLAAEERNNAGNTEGARLSWLLTPSKDLTLRFTATTQRTRRDGSGTIDLDAVTGQPLEGDLTHRSGSKEVYRNRVTLYGLDVEYDLGWARLNAITSAQDASIDIAQDLTSGYVPVLVSLGFPAVAANLSANVGQHRRSQEFRLTSQPNGGVDWLLGVYLNRERGSQLGSVDALLEGSLGGVNLLNSFLPSAYRENALYGDATWHLTPALALTGGVRVGRNRQTYVDQSDGPLVGAPSVSGGHSAETSTTYLATARYALTPVSNVYFRAASGYRPGGPNGLKPDTPRDVVPSAFQSDSLWSYELGYKANLLDRRLSVEAAIYDIEWRNLQQPLTAGAFTFTTNTGSARVRGAELSLSWAPTADWRLTASGTVIDAYLTTDAPALGASAGARLPNSARFSAALGATRSFTVGGHSAYLGLNAHHVGQRNTGYVGSAVSPNFSMPAYTLVDLQAGIDFKRFSLAGYVRNLGNRRALLSAGVSDSNLGLAQAGIAQPRTIGLGVNLPF
nr:TonB-dependent receptor [uncultured Roseateles sp.]